MRLTLFNNFLIHNYIRYTFLHIIPIMCWFWRGRKIGVPGEKPSKHRRGQLRELSHMKYNTRLGFIGERHNALTACATSASQMQRDCSFPTTRGGLVYHSKPASNFIEVSLPSEFQTRSITTLRTARFFWMFGAGGSFMLLTFLTIQIYLIAKYPIRSKLDIGQENWVHASWYGSWASC